MIRFACRITFLCLTSQIVTAQQISMRTLQLGGGEMPEAWVWVADEDQPVKVEWLTKQPTQPLRVLHDGTLKLFRFSVNAEGKSVVEDIQSIPFPAGASEVLLLGQVNDGKASYLTIEDRFLKAKFNDWIAINTSSVPVAIRCGDKGSRPVRVDAGKSLIFRPDVEENKGAAIVAMAPHDGSLRTFYSTYWPVFPGQRAMIIFYSDGEKMRARHIGDRFLREKKKPQAADLGEP